MVEHALSALSKALFKNAYVLPVAVTVLGFRDGRFTKRQVARALNISDNLVTAPFHRLAQADAIKLTGLVDLDGQHFERLDHAFWRFVAELVGDEATSNP
jgi:BarA-like signal transduction histidine kinase